MEFSFSKIVRDISEQKQGIERIEEISNILNNNDAFRSEAKHFIDYLLEEMYKENASDLDMGGVGSQNKVWMRAQGSKSPIERIGKINNDDAAVLVCSILTPQKISAIIKNLSTDFSYKITLAGDPNEKPTPVSSETKKVPLTIRYRANSYLDLDFLAVNFRLINPVLFPLESLNFPPPILRKFDLDFEKKGLILVTGVTGSGKSTTLDAIINMNNQKNKSHITIIGSPIEYYHKSSKCIVRHREVGRDARSFKDATIESLRQDPDIIVIGEMRDPETIITALEITDSGHKVFSTLHTGSATESIHRIVAECPSDEQSRVRTRLADVLSVVISQKLVPSLDGKRVLAKEILNVTSNVSAAIINNNISEIYQMINEGKDHGMITLEQDLLRLFINKVISKKNAIAYANNKMRMVELLQYYQK